VKLRKIYTEHIHHITCIICTEANNTNDCSHELTKQGAAEVFESDDWKYVKGKGWHCQDCAEKEPK